jgi:hypothetical protein
MGRLFDTSLQPGIQHGGGSNPVSGLDNVLKNLDLSEKRIEEAGAAGVYGQWLALDEMIVRKGMVPMATGRLAASHYVTMPEEKSGQPTCEMGYGVEYAEKVHEDAERKVSFQKVTDSGTVQVDSQRGYKWLERATQIHARALLVRMNESVSAFIARGVAARDLAGAVPTTPQDTGGDYRKALRVQRSALRRAARKSGLKLVKHWKRPRRKEWKG